jgi:hypothetical protein
LKDATEIDLNEVKWIIVIEKEVCHGEEYVCMFSNHDRQPFEPWQPVNIGETLWQEKALS